MRKGQFLEMFPRTNLSLWRDLWRKIFHWVSLKWPWISEARLHIVNRKIFIIHDLQWWGQPEQKFICVLFGVYYSAFTILPRQCFCPSERVMCMLGRPWQHLAIVVCILCHTCNQGQLLHWRCGLWCDRWTQMFPTATAGIACFVHKTIMTISIALFHSAQASMK